MKGKVIRRGNCLPLLVISILFVLYSCSRKNQNETQLLQALDESLVRSNQSINKATEHGKSETIEKEIEYTVANAPCQD
jgi:hypothetical protein